MQESNRTRRSSSGRAESGRGLRKPSRCWLLLTQCVRPSVLCPIVPWRLLKGFSTQKAQPRRHPACEPSLPRSCRQAEPLPTQEACLASSSPRAAKTSRKVSWDLLVHVSTKTASASIRSRRSGEQRPSASPESSRRRSELSQRSAALHPSLPAQSEALVLAVLRRGGRQEGNWRSMMAGGRERRSAADADAAESSGRGVSRPRNPSVACPPHPTTCWRGVCMPAVVLEGRGTAATRARCQASRGQR